MEFSVRCRIAVVAAVGIVGVVVVVGIVIVVVVQGCARPASFAAFLCRGRTSGFARSDAALDGD
jgi:hypothetical protein